MICYWFSICILHLFWYHCCQPGVWLEQLHQAILQISISQLNIFHKDSKYLQDLDWTPKLQLPVYLEHPLLQHVILSSAVGIVCAMYHILLYGARAACSHSVWWGTSSSKQLKREPKDQEKHWSRLYKKRKLLLYSRFLISISSIFLSISSLCRFCCCCCSSSSFSLFAVLNSASRDGG